MYFVHYFLFYSYFFSNVHSADPTIVIHWSTVTMDGDPDLLKDRNGNPLSIGSGGNGTVTCDIRYFRRS